MASGSEKYKKGNARRSAAAGRAAFQRFRNSPEGRRRLAEQQRRGGSNL